VYGTANAESDWDYIIVTNQHTTSCFVEGTKKLLHSHTRLTCSSTPVLSLRALARWRRRGEVDARPPVPTFEQLGRI
jgi:hypothetical protein